MSTATIDAPVGVDVSIASGSAGSKDTLQKEAAKPVDKREFRWTR